MQTNPGCSNGFFKIYLDFKHPSLTFSQITIGKSSGYTHMTIAIKYEEKERKKNRYPYENYGNE